MMRGNRLPALCVALESSETPRPVSSPFLRWTARSGRVLKRGRCQALVNPRAYSAILHPQIETGRRVGPCLSNLRSFLGNMHPPGMSCRRSMVVMRVFETP